MKIGEFVDAICAPHKDTTCAQCGVNASTHAFALSAADG
jgi:hypothetical protein